MKGNKGDHRGLHLGQHKEKMDGKAGIGPKGTWGDTQGNMASHVEETQRPHASYSQEFQGKTTEYIERQNAHQRDNAKHIENKAYKGRYS